LLRALFSSDESQSPGMLERSVQAVMAFRDVATGCGEKTQVAFDLLCNVLAGRDLHPRGGQLDS